jgi:hypothetical protein
MSVADIEVKESGLVLTWKVVAALAATFLGIYVTQVVAPLETEVNALRATVKSQQLAMKGLNDALIQINQHVVLDEKEDRRVEKTVERLTDELDALDDKLNAHLLRHATNAGAGNETSSEGQNHVRENYSVDKVCGFWGRGAYNIGTGYLVRGACYRRLRADSDRVLDIGYGSVRDPRGCHYLPCTV